MGGNQEASECLLEVVLEIHNAEDNLPLVANEVVHCKLTTVRLHKEPWQVLFKCHLGSFDLFERKG